MAELRRRCLELFTGGHLVIVVLTGLGIAGGAVGVYAGLHRDVGDNRRAVEDLRQDLDQFIERTERWQLQEAARTAENDREMRAGMRILVEKIIDMGGKEAK